jgi:hypothetical protein
MTHVQRAGVKNVSRSFHAHRPGGEPLWNVPKDLVKFSALRGRSETVLNRRLPELPHALFCPSFRSKIVKPHDGPKKLTRVETFPGAARLTRFPVMRASTQTCGAVCYVPKRLARRSLPESKRRGEVLLPSRPGHLTRLFFQPPLLGAACAESPYIVYQIPDVIVRFDFSKRWHPAQPDAVFHNPEQFTIGVFLHITRCQV